MSTRKKQVRSSAIWAAYGDALGFMTELADVGRLEHRTGQRQVERTVKWRRKVGSRGGGFAVLPAGTYSDDTQLRLSTSRAIRADGSFDVAAFAKVELPAWLSYSLGAGVGSREAAYNLARSSASWYANFFENSRSSYFRGGGNGAAMRVQPHVWAASNLSDRPSILRQVLRNAVCTHGHARGILGACFHALTLSEAMLTAMVPDPDALLRAIDQLSIIPEVVGEDKDLAMFWLGPWLERHQTDFGHAVKEVQDELRHDLAKLLEVSRGDPEASYNLGLAAVDAFSAASRGSGTKTALLASYLAYLFRDTSPEAALVTASNVLGSDTDTIGTMAGAILGACSDAPCDNELQDRDYIVAEADRLAAIAEGNSDGSFVYPDLRSWKPSRVAADAIVRNDAGLFLNGIGRLDKASDQATSDGTDFEVGWYRLEFGQTILARTRIEPSRKVGSHPTVSPRQERESAAALRTASRLPDLFGRGDVGPSRTMHTNDAPQPKPASLIHNQLEEVIVSGFDPELIGRYLLEQVRADAPDFIERTVALTSVIATAYHVRLRRRRS